MRHSKALLAFCQLALFQRVDAPSAWVTVMDRKLVTNLSLSGLVVSAACLSLSCLTSKRFLCKNRRVQFCEITKYLQRTLFSRKTRMSSIGRSSRTHINALTNGYINGQASVAMAVVVEHTQV